MDKLQLVLASLPPRRVWDDLFEVFCIAALLFGVPSAIAISILRRVLRKASRQRWSITAAIVTVWFFAAVYQVLMMLGLASIRGPDSGWAGMELMFLRIPLWLFFFGPSIPCLFLVVIYSPLRIGSRVADCMKKSVAACKVRARKLYYDPKRVYILGAVLVGIAALLRVLAVALLGGS